MNKDLAKQTFIDNVMKTFRIINPNRKRSYSEPDYYVDGWNDCLKEIKRLQKRLIEHMESTF